MDYQQKIAEIVKDASVKKALELLKSQEQETLDVQLELCAIQSPSNQEEIRARRFYELMKQIGLDDVYMDEVNNVIGLRKGTGNGPTLVIAAHMDTVFSQDTDCTPRKDKDGWIWAPGICDDTRGMAEVYSIAKVFCEAGIRSAGDIYFVGDVGEESMGDLKGSRHLFDSNKNIDAFLSIDGAKPENLVIHGIGGYKYRFTYTGRGGHALSAFGIPNANNALGYAAAGIAALEVPESPRTIFNIGVMNGGVSVNAIPTEAMMMLDIRSMGQDTLECLNQKVLDIVKSACEKENRRWNHPTEKIELKIELLSHRPCGTQNVSDPIVQAGIAAYKHFGITPYITPGNSTDSNIPISRGIPALTVSRGGIQLDGHTVNERFDPTDAYVGPQKDLVLALMISGLDGICPSVLREK